jgi:hypothetical protein
MKYHRGAWLSAIFSIFFFSSGVLATAQSIVTGALTGVVTDPSGAVVSGAQVSLTDTSTGDILTTTTGAAGFYQFPLLKPGGYSVTVEHDGFQKSVQSVSVLLGRSSSADVTLHLGSTGSTVEVTGAVPFLQKEDANITTNFDTRTIQGLPNPGADLTYVAQLAPGVTMNTSAGNGHGNFSVFGLPGTANLFTFDGNDLNDPYFNVNNSGASSLTLGLNDVSEVAVISNGYTGQYGRQAGAQIDYTTRSGTNEYHGNAVYYWNGSALNAQDYFLGGTPKTFENNNQWAASFGGPLKKDKAFFFVNTEGIRYVFGTSSDVWVPTPAFENYTFSQIPSTATAFYQKTFALYNGTAGISRAVPQPDSCGSSVLPIAHEACLEEFHNSGTNGNHEWLLQIRGDYDFSASDKVFAQVNIDRGVQPAYTDPISPLFNIVSDQPLEYAQLNYTHAFSPSIINNFVGSIFYDSVTAQSPNLRAALTAFPGDFASFDTSITPLGTGSGEFLGFSLSPSGRRVTQWQLVDDVSFQHGRHDFKAGINFRRDDITDLQAGVGAAYPYLSVFSLESFATDQADFVTQNFTQTPEQPIAYHSLGLYFQDEIRVKPNLKFTLALRADRNSPGVCQSNCGALPVQPFAQLNHSAAIPYSQMMDAGRHQILRGIEAVSLQPRIGVAWTPLGPNTVIRGGVGVFSDLYPGFLLDSWTTNFPEVTSFALVDAGTLDPQGTKTESPAVSVIAGCNNVFQSNYKAGGTVTSFLKSAPSGCAVPNLNDAPSKLLNPKYVEWNWEIQHSFGSRTVVSVNYVGNHGYNLFVQYPDSNAYDSGGFGGLPTVVPDSRVGFVYELTNRGTANYNGLTFSLQQAVWKGLSARLNYTYSHTLDDLSNGGDDLAYSKTDSILYQINPRNLSLNYGSADYDLRHSFTFGYIWDLPLKSANRAVDAAMGGWEVSGTVFAHSAFPFTIVDGDAALNLYDSNGSPDLGLYFAGILAQPAGKSISRTCTSTTTPCWKASDFATSTSFGTIARNSFRGPGYFNTDFSLRKNFRLSDRFNFEIGANAYNVFNHPNFANPSNNLSSSNLGVITSTVTPPTSPYGAGASAAVDARIIQIVSKLTF